MTAIWNRHLILPPVLTAACWVVVILEQISLGALAAAAVALVVAIAVPVAVLGISQRKEEDNGDDGCLDDWEAVADALAEDDKHQNLGSELPPADEPVVQMVSPCEVTSNVGAWTSEMGNARLISGAWGNSRAWRPNDAFRPRSLPNLSKQHNANWHYGGGVPWACATAPLICPICCEDLDYTDSNFLPCLCGFWLCIFCHKRIFEDAVRCPACRKPYETTY